MGKRKIFRLLFSALLAVTMLAVAACTPEEAAALQGILKNVDSANGQITIVTKDGKTVTLDIATDTEVAADGTNSTVASLEPGATVEIKVKNDGKVASQIKAQQAEIEGVITAIVGDNVTIETEKGRQATIHVTADTRIELDDDDFPGTLAGLAVGMAVEAKYSPSTGNTFKIEAGKDEDEDDETSALIPGGKGIIEIRVTDPPPAGVASAVVYLSNIEVHRVLAGASANTSGNVSDNDTGWVTLSSNITSFDLMDVIGVEAFLASANVDAGKFTQIRMDVDRVEVVTTDGDNITAEVPGGKLRIVRPFDVDAGVKTILTLDFDGEKSLVLTGQGKAIFKPVVKLDIDKEED